MQKTIYLFIIFGIIAAYNTGNIPTAVQYYPNTINMVLGDISFTEKFAVQPSAYTNEHLRITTHLEFVITQLEKKDILDLSQKQKTNRLEHIRNLKAYTYRGLFPINTDYPGERRSRFVDHLGTDCAVGHLIRKSGHPKLLEIINSNYEYAYVKDMEIPELLAWQLTSGLSLYELEMIQPTYGGDTYYINKQAYVDSLFELIFSSYEMLQLFNYPDWMEMDTIITGTGDWDYNIYFHGIPSEDDQGIDDLFFMSVGWYLYYYHYYINITAGFSENDLAVLSDIIQLNNIDELTPIEIGEQYWASNRLVYFKYYNSNLNLTSLPESFGSLTGLQHLDLFQNELNSIPFSVGEFDQLKYLSLSYNQLESFPEGLWSLSNLDNLLLIYNQIGGQIPDEICDLNLDYLGISNNNLCPPYPDCISYIGTQDTSECTEECSITGDVNNDGEVNVLDVVDVVGCALGNPCPDCSDVNGDGVLNILDIVMMVNIILEG